MAEPRPSTAPNYDDAAPPRLTRLELIGFKSFATKTTFQFERGITAIIGPNGSGKSNIADAVRWALGETSYSSLRSKRTEDVIFAGGQGKAPAGMAEVTLTFDNDGGWLPIDFAEVTVTRRAFRSGETAYLINGRKVRLRDVHQLTASLGQSYTVVGQGLVDAALSQRAEERRGLFEHAADLTGLRLKAAEAERNLAETESNTARLTDLLAEVEPRLRSLERAARQANEYRDVRDRLRTLQRAHFRRQLIDTQCRLDEVEWTASEGQRGAETLQARHDELAAEAERLRHLREAANARLEEHRAGVLATSEELRRVAHEREIAIERLSALVRRREDMAESQGGLDEQIAAVGAELAEVRAQLATVTDEVAAARRALIEAETALTAERAERTELGQERARILAVVTDHERLLADAARGRALLVQRIETDAAERERGAQAQADRAERLQRLQAELTALDQFEETSGYRLTSIDAGMIEITTSIAGAQSEATAARRQVALVEPALAEARARLRELQRIHESGTGLHAGVKAVMKAAKFRDLTGINGTIGELIALPAAFDTAIEVALGGHLQDIVVDTWVHAEAAIRFLKKENAGRATFQPIDTVRGRRASSDALREVTGLPGVHGVACDLLTVAPELNGIVTALLGRTLVVADLDVARACLPHLPSGWNAVTLAGEIVRTAGSVTGGAAVRESGALSRERGLRELPGEIATLEEELAQAQTAADAAADRVRALQEDRQQLEAERAAVLVTRREREGQRARIVVWLDELTREAERAGERGTALEENRAANEATIAEIDEEIRVLAGERDAARRHLDEAARRMDADQVGPSAIEQTVRDCQRRAIGSDERLNAERRRESSLASQLETLREERAVRSEREAAIEGEISALQGQVERLASEVAALEAAHVEAQTAQEPVAGEASKHVFALVEVERELESARAQLIEAERQRGLCGIEVERARGEAMALRQRISDELELNDPSELLTTDTAMEDEPDQAQAEAEIARLKDRLRRVGYAGDNAVEDYERERERHAFLREQLADVEGASAAIRQLLDELRATMRDRFVVTFERVSIVFSQTFSSLFGGGSARLVMVTGEDDERGGGIDIVAQPPGKRLQTLALLSGGERALTGVALLFAILKVNPTPFCMLDEVDAALDEANIVRFREQLQTLARETQAIIITHNRGTIEAANTLYGVSMRDDGVSTVLSLRLSDVVLSD